MSIITYCDELNELTFDNIKNLDSEYFIEHIDSIESLFLYNNNNISENELTSSHADDLILDSDDHLSYNNTTSHIMMYSLV